MDTDTPANIRIACGCGDIHEAEYSHEGRFGEGHIWVSYCPVDGLGDYWTVHAAI